MTILITKILSITGRNFHSDLIFIIINKLLEIQQRISEKLFVVVIYYTSYTVRQIT